MKKLFCAILMLLLCVSCFAGTLYIKAGEKIITYENVAKMADRGGVLQFFFLNDGRKIVVPTYSEWWYVE